ncbi:MAG: heavy-metal-associated domain-containing protein [Saprospiraceae bacterium]|nr:heavy-metal-associated domain-containing protein [Saprospiraceae bacterium]
MIKYIFSIILCAGLFTTTYGQEIANAQIEDKVKTETFTVYGNCGMCKKTIEKSLKNAIGVSEASWDKESGEMKVTFEAKSISLDEIKQMIADVGYDSETHRAKEEVYNMLPACCQYQRPE